MSILETLQSDVANYLNQDPYFSTIEIVAPRTERAAGVIDAALAGARKKNGKTGACVQVLMPMCDVDKPSAPGPAMEIAIIVRVQEYPVINMGDLGTLKSAEDIALWAANQLHHFHPVGITGPLFPAPDFITPNPAFLPRVTLDIKFRALVQMARRKKVATPIISPDSGNVGTLVTITCATANATIYYTTDGTFPAPGNGTEYTAPFEAVTAEIRAAAYRPGYQSSDVAYGHYTLQVLATDAELMIQGDEGPGIVVLL